MPRRCKICDHPNHWDFNMMIVQGVSLRVIAAAAGASHMSVWRHKWNHLTALLAPYARDFFRF